MAGSTRYHIMAIPIVFVAKAMIIRWLLISIAVFAAILVSFDGTTFEVSNLQTLKNETLILIMEIQETIQARWFWYSVGPTGKEWKPMEPWHNSDRGSEHYFFFSFFGYFLVITMSMRCWSCMFICILGLDINIDQACLDILKFMTRSGRLTLLCFYFQYNYRIY